MALKLSIPYDLPFVLARGGEPLLGAGGTIEVRAEAGLSAAETLTPPLTLFNVLAQTGALSGSDIEPSESTIGDFDPPATPGTEIVWTLKGCRIDERASLILANLLAAPGEKGLKRLSIVRPASSSAPETALRGREATYPGRWKSVPFPVDLNEAATDTRVVEIAFARDPSPQEIEVVEVDLLIWGDATQGGAYASIAPPWGPLLIPDSKVEVSGRELVWGLTKFQSSVGALEGLVNMCAAIHKDVCPVASLRIG